MSEWAETTSLLEAAVGEARVCPAAMLLVARGDSVVFEHGAGMAGAPGREKPCDERTIFDLASLTKPLVTAALTLDLIGRDRISLDTRVAELLPDFAKSPRGLPADDRRLAVTVRDLLRHDSGLPAYRHFYEAFDGAAPATARDEAYERERIFAMALSEPLEREPRSGSVYSDIGFMVLGAIVEKITGERIDAVARRRLFDPLGLEDLGFIDLVTGTEPAFAERCAATGPCGWRHREVHAVVQDENAYAMGGIAPHAGLFATARVVHRLLAEWANAWAGHGSVLDRRLVVHAWNRSAAAAGAAPSSWALGWDTPTPGASSAGSRVGQEAVGHLGYTGTSMWFDPMRRAHVILLTNRVAYGRNGDAIRALRPKLHDAVFAALDRMKH